MQQTIQAQTIGVEWIRGELTSKFTEFLLDLIGYSHIKNTLHQGLDRKKVRIDVLHVSHRLLKGVGGLVGAADRRCMNLSITEGRTMLLLQVFEHAARKCAECLKGGPAQFLLLTEGGVLANQPVMLSIEALTIRALAGLFWHFEPEARCTS